MKNETYFQAVAKNKKLYSQGIISKIELINFNKQALTIGV